MSLAFLGGCGDGVARSGTDDFEFATATLGEDFDPGGIMPMFYGVFTIEDDCVYVAPDRGEPFERSRAWLPVFPDGSEAVMDENGIRAVRLPDETIIEFGPEYAIDHQRLSASPAVFGDDLPCADGIERGVYVGGLIDPEAPSPN
ncbi:hypothetical protein CZ771_03830 [Actinomycetales bacterium JB111]|nr:hypothetical protein CZ771_03830 [Actinomycetales bacterium JB111]